MPDIKELCRITDALTRGLEEVRTQVANLAKLFEAQTYFSGKGDVPGGAPPAPAAAAPGSVSPAVSATPPPVQKIPSGPRQIIGSDVFEGHEKNAPRSKRGEFSEDRSDKTEAEFIRRMIKEMEEERHWLEPEAIGMHDLDQSKNSPSMSDPMEKIKEITDKMKADMKVDMERLSAQTKLDIQRSGLNLLTNVFGRRIVNMLTPEKMHGGDMLFMVQNLKWIDGKVQNAMNRSILEKVASGEMTKAQAASAGGFMSTEALGAQLLGGALAGIFIAKHIPKLVEIAKDMSELKESVGTMMTGDRNFSGAVTLQKWDAWASTVDSSSKKTDEMLGSRTMLGMSVDKESAKSLRSHLHKIMADDKFLDSAIKQFNENASESTRFSSGWLRGFSKLWKFS